MDLSSYWSIGFEGTEDLKYAQIVADHIGSIHHNICVSEQEFLDAIPDVVYAIESYDTTTVFFSVVIGLFPNILKKTARQKLFLMVMVPMKPWVDICIFILLEIV